MSGELLYFGDPHVDLADANRLLVSYASNISTAPVTSCPGYASCADLCSVGSSAGPLPVAAIAGGVVGGIVALALLSLALFKARKTFRPPAPPEIHVPYAVPVQVAVVATDKSQYDVGN